jgi:hypothetical protein
MMTNTNNILSYFIKDIKDPKEQALYKGIKTKQKIQIFHKDELIYEIEISLFKYIRYNNYKKNISMSSYIFYNYKLYLDKINKVNYLYYKNDNKLLTYNYNYICYNYEQNKYLTKKNFIYKYNNTIRIATKFYYYKGYTYIFKFIESVCKISHSLILINNKYEFHYYNRFFNLYFAQ